MKKVIFFLATMLCTVSALFPQSNPSSPFSIKVTKNSIGDPTIDTIRYKCVTINDPSIHYPPLGFYNQNFGIGYLEFTFTIPKTNLYHFEVLDCSSPTLINANASGINKLKHSEFASVGDKISFNIFFIANPPQIGGKYAIQLRITPDEAESFLSDFIELDFCPDKYRFEYLVHQNNLTDFFNEGIINPNSSNKVSDGFDSHSYFELNNYFFGDDLYSIIQSNSTFTNHRRYQIVLSTLDGNIISSSYFIPNSLRAIKIRSESISSNFVILTIKDEKGRACQAIKILKH